ncbi:transposase domain-containing protein, partial [Pseudomonas aeruginosa]|uniref:transposase domain-containing protein n=1 Tax=Pseudomonas aeruginosa TaxID=287 RepID=UPI002E799FD7
RDFVAVENVARVNLHFFFDLVRRPWALGRANWLFAGSLRSGQRGAALMTLIQSARLNGHDPYAYLKDVLTRLPTQKASALAELLPHNWVSAGKV